MEISGTSDGRPTEPGKPGLVFPEAQFRRLRIVAQLLHDAPAGTGPRLLWRDEGGAVRAHLLAGDVVIGRATECGLVLTDPGVSRRHCRLWRSAGEHWVEDLGSLAGTRVNDGATPRLLHDGDLIAVGGVALVYMTET